MKSLSKAPDALSKWGADAVEKMSKGKIPDNMIVHHKKPLFRGGNNRNSNFELMDKDYHTVNNIDLHWYPEGMNPFGLN